VKDELESGRLVNGVTHGSVKGSSLTHQAVIAWVERRKKQVKITKTSSWVPPNHGKRWGRSIFPLRFTI